MKLRGYGDLLETPRTLSDVSVGGHPLRVSLEDPGVDHLRRNSDWIKDPLFYLMSKFTSPRDLLMSG